MSGFQYVFDTKEQEQFYLNKFTPDDPIYSKTYCWAL